MSIKGIHIPIDVILTWVLRLFTAICVSAASYIGIDVLGELKQGRRDVSDLKTTIAVDHERYATKDSLQETNQALAVTKSNVESAQRQIESISKMLQQLPQKVVEAIKN